MWLKTELDDKKFSYQQILTITKLEKETKHQLNVFIEKKLVEMRDNSARIHLHAGMTCQLSYYTVQLQAWHLLCAITAQIGLAKTNKVR